MALTVHRTEVYYVYIKSDWSDANSFLIFTNLLNSFPCTENVNPFPHIYTLFDAGPPLSVAKVANCEEIKSGARKKESAKQLAKDNSRQSEPPFGIFPHERREYLL